MIAGHSDREPPFIHLAACVPPVRTVVNDEAFAVARRPLLVAREQHLLRSRATLHHSSFAPWFTATRDENVGVLADSRNMPHAISPIMYRLRIIGMFHCLENRVDAARELRQPENQEHRRNSNHGESRNRRWAAADRTCLRSLSRVRLVAAPSSFLRALVVPCNNHLRYMAHRTRHNNIDSRSARPSSTSIDC